MSVQLMTKVLRSQLSTSTHKFVLLMFADFANRDGLCWPSLSTIAEQAQLSRRQIQRIVADLRQDGLLEVVKEPSGVLATMYRVRGDNLTPLGGDTMSTPLDARVYPGATPVSTPYILETVKETNRSNYDTQLQWLRRRYENGKAR